MKKGQRIFMFSVLFRRGVLCVRPRAFTERPYEFDFLSAGKPALWKAPLLSAFLAEKRWVHKDFGRELVFSADLCYNGTNKKASHFGRGGGEADTPSNPLSRELSQRESLWLYTTLGVWVLPEAFVKQRRNLCKNRTINKNLMRLLK